MTGSGVDCRSTRRCWPGSFHGMLSETTTAVPPGACWAFMTREDPLSLSRLDWVPTWLGDCMSAQRVVDLQGLTAAALVLPNSSCTEKLLLDAKLLLVSI